MLRRCSRSPSLRDPDPADSWPMSFPRSRSAPTRAALSSGSADRRANPVDVAEELAGNLDQLPPAAREHIATEAMRRRKRPRSALRLALGPLALLEARRPRDTVVSRLARIGSAQDVTLFRSWIGRTEPTGRMRWVCTQAGHPTVRIKALAWRRFCWAESLRRGEPPKVLGLLRFLASSRVWLRPAMRPSKPLRPDLGPETAADSLHDRFHSSLPRCSSRTIGKASAPDTHSSTARR